MTYCPLTGSGLVFDKGSAGWERVDLGVSGLLFANNLLMYDRATGRLIGPQMSVAGRCGDFDGVEPDLLPVTETTWGRWTQLHGNTLVVSEATGWNRNYRQYPYVDGGQRYDAVDHRQVYFPQSVDRSRPIKELVLGVRTSATSGVGYPFGELAALGRAGALDDEVDGHPVVVFWEAGTDVTGGTAVAFDRRADGQTLSFGYADGWVRDEETGSRWTLGGRAIDGPLQGTQLTQVEDAYVAFWFAWRHFQPDGRVFEAP